MPTPITIQAEAVREAVDIVSLIEEFVPLRRGGKELIGKCPFHEEKTPSFAINASKQLFHCYGCGAGGDVIAFEMRIHGLSFQDALQSLAARAGLQTTSTPVTIQQRAFWAQARADSDLIEHHRLMYVVSKDTAGLDFAQECERDPAYRAWLERDLQNTLGICSVLVGLIAKAQQRERLNG